MFEHIENREAGDGSTATRGFTLIELLVVVVILGIMASVVVFSVTGVRQEAETNACATEMRALHTALETYYAEEGAWPADLDALSNAGFVRNMSFAGTYHYVPETGALTLNSCPTS